MSDSELVNKSLRNALQLIRDEATKPLHAEIERLRDTLRITDPNDLLGRLQAAEADLAEATALLRRWVGAANWRQGPEHRVVPLMDDTLIFLDKFNEED